MFKMLLLKYSPCIFNILVVIFYGTIEKRFLYFKQMKKEVL